MKQRTEKRPRVLAMLRRSLREAKAGKLVSLGSFAKYARKN